MPTTKALERVYYASLFYTLLGKFQLCVLDLVVIGVMQVMVFTCNDLKFSR